MGVCQGSGIEVEVGVALHIVLVYTLRFGIIAEVDGGLGAEVRTQPLVLPALGMGARRHSSSALGLGFHLDLCHVVSLCESQPTAFEPAPCGLPFGVGGSLPRYSRRLPGGSRRFRKTELGPGFGFL